MWTACHLYTGGYMFVKSIIDTIAINSGLPLARMFFSKLWKTRFRQRNCKCQYFSK